MDLKDTVFKYILRSSQFQEYPELLQPYERDAAYTTNHYIAERRMFQVIRARMLVFEYLWRAIEQMYPSRDVNEFKIRWLFLQLCPSDVLREDVFTDLVDILKDAEDDYLMKRSGGLDKDLFKLQDSFRSLKDFVIVLDEAQVLGEKLPRAFRSERDDATTRPVLRPIISALKTASSCPNVVAGTGLSIELVNEVITSAVGKPARFTLVTKTGAFDDPERQRKYILRYMPRHIAESESGKEFLVRAWRWVRGRYVVKCLH